MFGEGMKVELNRLLASGCRVRYWTGFMTWHFQYVADQTLHLTANYLPEPGSGTSVVIADPDHAVPGQWLLQRDRFLLFDPPKPEQQFGGLPLPSGQQPCPLQLLDGQQYRGRVYVHGTLVMETRLLNTPGHMQFGLNFLGSKQAQRDMGLSREGNSISLSQLMLLLPELYVQLKSQPPHAQQQKQAAQILEAVTNSLQLLDTSEAATKCLVDEFGCTESCQDPHWANMVEDIYSLLQQKAEQSCGHHNFYLDTPASQKTEVSCYCCTVTDWSSKLGHPPSFPAMHTTSEHGSLASSSDMYELLCAMCRT